MLRTWLTATWNSGGWTSRGVRRTYWLARGPGGPAPLLMLLAWLFLVAGTVRESSRQAVPVPRLSWSGPDGLPVVLYCIEGGGHGWPGAPQYLLARVVGPIPRHLDATGIRWTW